MKLKAFNISMGSLIFKAFSEEARIRILHLIYRNEEMCISDLEQILDFTQTKTSRHLIYLKNTGLLGFRKKDQWVYYYIKEEFMGIVFQIFGFLEKDPVLVEDLKNFSTLYANNILALRKLHNEQNRYKLPEL
jgi:ArsR family transcriptional regulator